MNHFASKDDPASAFIPYFDKDAMLRLSAEEDGQRVFELLAASKSKASACLDSIPSLDGLSPETSIKISLQLLEKGWSVRIFSWLNRLLNEAPEILGENIIAIIEHEYWVEDLDTDVRLSRRRELFSERLEEFFYTYIDSLESRGLWDPKFRRAYGFFLKRIAKKSLPAAKSFREAFQKDNDIAAIVPYAEILFEKRKYNRAIEILNIGWEQYRDIESLRALTQAHFMLKNSKEAIMLYDYLRAIGEPLSGDLLTHLRDYQFPRDFEVFEKLGENSEDHFIVPDLRENLYDVLEKSLDTGNLEENTAIIYKLRVLRLKAIEFRDYSASMQFVTLVMSLLEGGWEKRDILKDFLEQYPLPRVGAFLKEEAGEENPDSDDFFGGKDQDSDNSFEVVLSIHLYLAARFAFTPERADMVKILKDFSHDQKLVTLQPLMEDLTLVHGRIKTIFSLLGNDFQDFYNSIQQSAIRNLGNEENYFATMMSVLEARGDIDSKEFDNHDSLLAFTMAAIVYGADIEYTERLIEKLHIDFIPPAGTKQLGRLLQNCGFERYALSAFALGNLQDPEVISSMLNLAFSGNHYPEDMFTALATRTDFYPQNPIDLRVIVADMLTKNIHPDGKYPAELLAMLGEAAIVHGEIRNGLSILRDAAAAGSIRAKTGIAGYYLYAVPRPKKALGLFEEIYQATHDPKFLADIARANQLIMENEAKKHPGQNPCDVSKLLTLIKDLPEEHPDYLSAYLEFSIFGDEEQFHKACTRILFSYGSELDSLTEELFEQYDIRLFDEIAKIEALQRIEWKDISRHIFYSRVLARIHEDDIEFTLDYFNDLLKYMEDFQIDDSKYSDKKGNETTEDRRKKLRNQVFTSLLKQFTEGGYSEDGEEDIFTFMERDETGKAIGVFDQVTEPLNIAMIYEVSYFEEIFSRSKKLPQLYDYVVEILENICEHPAIANQYEEKRRKILEILQHRKRQKGGIQKLSTHLQ